MTEGEAELYMWQFQGMLGHFKTALWAAIQHADTGNLELLRKAFPEQVDAYIKFSREHGYWDRIKSEFEAEYGQRRA